MSMYSPNQQKVTHLHYHYHYYQTTANDSRIEIKKMSKSQMLPSKAEEKVWSGRKEEESVQEVSENRHRERSFRKLRISDCWSTENSTRETYKQQKQTQATEISSFTVKQEQHSIDEVASPHYPSTFATAQAAHEEEGMDRLEKSMIAQYQSELEWYKKEVNRLRMVEEECIFLRKTCLQHYQKCSEKQSD